MIRQHANEKLTNGTFHRAKSANSASIKLKCTPSRGRHGLLVLCSGYITKTIWVHRAFWQCKHESEGIWENRFQSNLSPLCVKAPEFKCVLPVWAELHPERGSVDVWKCVAEFQVTENKTKQSLTGQQASPPQPVLQVAMTSITCTHTHTNTLKLCIFMKCRNFSICYSNKQLLSED